MVRETVMAPAREAWRCPRLARERRPAPGVPLGARAHDRCPWWTPHATLTHTDAPSDCAQSSDFGRGGVGGLARSESHVQLFVDAREIGGGNGGGRPRRRRAPGRIPACDLAALIRGRRRKRASIARTAGEPRCTRSTRSRARLAEARAHASAHENGFRSETKRHEKNVARETSLPCFRAFV